MSKQELSLHWAQVDIAQKQSDEIIINFLTQSQRGLSPLEAENALNICRYQSTHNEIPDGWMLHIEHSINAYQEFGTSMKTLMERSHLREVFLFLDGSDFVKLELAFGNTKYFEDVARHLIEVNPDPRKRYKLNIKDRWNFPVHQTCQNYKFLYHLLYSYPNLSIIGGPYSEPNGCRAHKTCLSIIGHRKYLLEKTIKGGGVALSINVFGRIVKWPYYFQKQPPAPPTNNWEAFKKHVFEQSQLIGIRPHELALDRNFDQQMKSLFIIPRVEFNDEHTDSLALHSLFRYFEEPKTRYKGICDFVRAIKPQMPDYPWDQTLHEMLVFSIKHPPLCAGKLMDAGAKINLSGNIPNQKTFGIIREMVCCNSYALKEQRLKVLKRIFGRANKRDFEDESEKLDENQMDWIIRWVDDRTSTVLDDLLRLLLKRSFILTSAAQNMARNYLFA